MMKLIEMILALLGALAGAEAGTIEHVPVESAPIVSRIWEDGSYLIDGEAFCHPLGGCSDGGTVTTPNWYVESVMLAEGWIYYAEEVIGVAPFEPMPSEALIDPVTVPGPCEGIVIGIESYVLADDSTFALGDGPCVAEVLAMLAT